MSLEMMTISPRAFELQRGDLLRGALDGEMDRRGHPGCEPDVWACRDRSGSGGASAAKIIAKARR
jgi:hypothetical protein